MSDEEHETTIVTTKVTCHTCADPQISKMTSSLKLETKKEHEEGEAASAKGSPKMRKVTVGRDASQEGGLRRRGDGVGKRSHKADARDQRVGLAGCKSPGPSRWTRSEVPNPDIPVRIHIRLVRDDLLGYPDVRPKIQLSRYVYSHPSRA